MVGANSSNIRSAKIADLRHQIATGTYETPEKLEAALEAMLTAQEGPASEAEKDSLRRPNRPK